MSALQAEPQAASSNGTDTSEGDLHRPHLLFFVCGIRGNPEPFRAVQALIEELKGSKVTVHICRRISGHTWEGIEAGAALIAAEIREHVALLGESRRPRSLSVWGHSMGGIVLRYALAEITDLATGTVCGLPPRFFCTTASPHLGIAGTFSPTVLRTATALGIYGRTGAQLCVEDPDALMVHLGTDERYLAPLRLFQYRLLIANICNDIIVDFCTAALQPRRAQWLMDAPAIDQKYPHVVYDSESWTSPVFILDRAAPDNSSSAVPRRRESGVREKSLPAAYYSGHARALELAKARRCLGEMPWRIVCARIDDGIFYENAHRSVCYEAEHDVVHYICEVLMKEPFGTHRRCLTFQAAGYGRPMCVSAAARRLRRNRLSAATADAYSAAGSTGVVAAPLEGIGESDAHPLLIPTPTASALDTVPLVISSPAPAELASSEIRESDSTTF